MSKLHRVLVFPSGSEIGLEVIRSLKNQKDVEVFAGTTEQNFTEALLPKDRITFVESVYSKSFESSIRSACLGLKIDFIIPAHDDVVTTLAKIDFEKAQVISHSSKTVTCLRSKKTTYESLNDVVACPKIFSFHEISEESKFPLFLKPDIGQGSKGTKLVKSFEDFKKSYSKELLILEYLPGDEFTIDCFTNSKGELIFHQGRKRIRIINGISARATFVENEKFGCYARAINSRFQFCGAWFFQLKSDDKNELKLLEVGARISGTSGMLRPLGVNLPYLSVLQASGLTVSTSLNRPNILLERSISPVFILQDDFDNLYVDLDDTLIIRNKVNPSVVRLIFDFINLKKKVFCITRHNKCPKQTLSHFRLLNVFDDIIHLQQSEPKSSSMLPNSLLIDDSYRERSDVQQNGHFAISPDSSDEILICNKEEI